MRSSSVAQLPAMLLLIFTQNLRQPKIADKIAEPGALV